MTRKFKWTVLENANTFDPTDTIKSYPTALTNFGVGLSFDEEMLF